MWSDYKRGSLSKRSIDTTGAMSVDLSGYQPAGNYLTSVPIGGTAIGGVKNGGNVTIETDGTMNAEGSSLGFNLKFNYESFSDFLNTMETAVLNTLSGFVLVANFIAYDQEGDMYRCTGTLGRTGSAGDLGYDHCNIVGWNESEQNYVNFVWGWTTSGNFAIATADSTISIDFYDTKNTQYGNYVCYLLAY